MSIKVLHTSDLHGRYKPLLAFDQPFDLWLDTGDFLPNKGRVPKTGYMIDPGTEMYHQTNWLGYKQLPKRLAEWLNGRPCITVPGNHDFISLHPRLRQAGIDAHTVIGGPVDLMGLRWAGFREINTIANEWPGEVDDFVHIVETCMGQNPDILVTHCPAAGLLDGYNGGYGVKYLTTQLTYIPHKIKHHFFGHSHEHGGRSQQEMNIHFHNGAEHIRVIEIDV